MLDKYKDKQKNFYNYITKALSDNKLSHAYLIEINNVNYADDLVRDFAKFLICNGINDQKICDLIDSNNCPNLIEIKGDSIIKKEKILNLQKEFFNTSLNGKKQVYIIYDASFLNEYSANSMLKFLEEPSSGVVAILLTNNLNNVKDTIKSRCQILKLESKKEKDYKKIFEKYYDKSLSKEEFITEECNKFINFYSNLEKNGIEVLKDKNIYECFDHMIELLNFGFYLYVDCLKEKLHLNYKKIIPCDNFVIKNDEIDDIIKKIEIINKFEFLYNKSVNPALFVDNFIISMGG